ncbi:PEP-CTERM sorting domain-containing protein [Thalassomonas viridans]|uniref:PEP-CTERM sorting domain-containing protein n=2 Tax=Thalassomonas viridans TaxID=137584 RepID=A0AAE9ZAM2_9GAMM|nr:PEP-CTERM sorting domain-containing protein [Thalassomonas viridans]
MGESDNVDGYRRSIYESSFVSSRFYDGTLTWVYPLQDIIETAGISIGSIITGNASASYMDEHVLYSHEHNEFRPEYTWGEPISTCMPTCEEFSLEHVVTAEGYTGYFSFETFIPKSLIDSSLVNGMLDFNINAVSGDFHLASATIETFTSSVSVPEPTTTGLLALGLFGLGLRRRNKSA